MTPTLTYSPPSTRGTTWITAYSYKLCKGMSRLLCKAMRCAQPLQQIDKVGISLLLATLKIRTGVQPLFGNHANNCFQNCRRKPRSQPLVCSFQVGGVWK